MSVDEQAPIVEPAPGGIVPDLLGETVRQLNICNACRYCEGICAVFPALSRLEGEGTPFDLLSPRELEVARMLCTGMRMEEIGRRLSLSGKTVATHKYRLYEKLGIRDTVALARLASLHGVSEPAYAI